METLPSRAPFFLASITFKPLLRRLPNMPMHNLRNSASFMNTVESAHLLCYYTKHQGYHQLLGSGCLPFTWANRSVPVWANNRTQNSGLVNFVLESQSLFAQISSIYQKTATKPWNWYQRWLWRNVIGVSVWNIPTGKTGLPFQTFRCSQKFSTETTGKVMFQPDFPETFCNKNGKKTVFHWCWLTYVSLCQVQ